MSGYKNLFIGEPHSKFSESEISAIQKWIKNGGNLLVTSSFSGDAAPGGDKYSKTNLSEVLNGLIFEDNSLGIDRGVMSGEPFDTKVNVDISKLCGVKSILCYDTGCLIKKSKSINSKIQIVAPSSSKTIKGVRISGNHISAADPYPKNANGNIFLSFTIGNGGVSAVGSSFLFKNDTIIREDNMLFINWLLLKSFGNTILSYIKDYTEKPQRHRLLHGYPFPNVMHSIHNERTVSSVQDKIDIDSQKPLLIGVLPHTFCNPLVKGCGFCTFPHENFRKSSLRETVENVSLEIKLFMENYKYFSKSPVKAIYFGGGTANLTPTDLFSVLCKNLASTFDCTNAEITLEGVPKYFANENYKYVSIMCNEFSQSNYRLSMGIQTFDEKILQSMGRQNFGDETCIKKIVDKVKDIRFKVSGDLLFNLPNQSLDKMKNDVRKLIDLNFDQISLYHLVMFRTLGTEWAKDREMLAALPNNNESLLNWLTLKELLENYGYRQTTLTNFEKENSHFEYEPNVFHPELNNWLGFGPSAISVLCDRKFDRAVKFINHETSSEYNQDDKIFWKKYFLFDEIDMKVLFITRKIALLCVDKRNYEKLFSSKIDNDFAEEIYYLQLEGLIHNNDNEIVVTPKGMFFSDTVAGVFAFRKMKLMKMLNLIKGLNPNDEKYFYSGEYNNGLRYRMG